MSIKEINSYLESGCCVDTGARIYLEMAVSELKEARKQWMLEAAEIGRIACQKTWHYHLGDEVFDAIRRKVEEL